LARSCRSGLVRCLVAIEIRADPKLLDLLHVQDSQRLITHKTTQAFLKVAATDSETVSGKKTIGLLIDELWLFGQPANAESMIPRKRRRSTHRNLA
jgi:phage terminase large subunit-like protein